jgi:Rha family phage regulatory protein
MHDFSALPDIDAGRSPVVQITAENEAMADSRDVAAYFGKAHYDVLRDIRGLIEKEPDLGIRNFAETPYVDRQNGQTYKFFAMDRRGFSLLAMGFTGAKALKWKLRYLDAFDAMESELRRRSAPLDATALLDDPDALRAMLLGYTAKVSALKAELATLAPKGEAYDRLLNAEGLIGLQDAGRALLCHPNLFIRDVIIPAYCYRDGSRIVAKQTSVQRGLFENKAFTAPNDKVLLRAWMTPKGLAHFGTVRIPDHVKNPPRASAAKPTPALAAAGMAH